jgi:SulP family sulfate permease
MSAPSRNGCPTTNEPAWFDAAAKSLNLGTVCSGDLWGGLAAMLVAFPAAIAFGVTIFGGIGPAYVPYGALAGIAGAVVIGLVAAILGGTDRLISAPCAPAAAVLSAFAIETMRSGATPELAFLLILLVGLAAGAIQVALGMLGVGGLIKYIPYPVVSGYLTGVGLIIIGSQAVKVLGTPDGMAWWHAAVAPALWDPRSLAIGAVTIGITLASNRVSTRVPSIVLGIAGGVLAYALLAIEDPALRQLEGNRLVIGALTVTGDGYLARLFHRWLELPSSSPRSRSACCCRSTR